jgi:hypothetical protein
LRRRNGVIRKPHWTRVASEAGAWALYEELPFVAILLGEHAGEPAMGDPGNGII